MQLTEKKAKELNELLAFQEKCFECPRSRPLQPEPPAPDIVFPESDLGIEITEYSLGQGKGGSQSRQLEVVHQRIIRSAQSEYEATNKHCLQVSVIWAIKKCPNKHEEKGIAQAIAQLVAAQDFWNQKIYRMYWKEFDDSFLKKYVHSIGIFLIGDEGQSNWLSTAGSAFPEERQRIRAALNEKESKISGYRQVCRNLWLLIVADGAFFTSQFYPDSNLLNTKFNSSFDRVFLIETPINSVHEIKVEHKPHSESV